MQRTESESSSCDLMILSDSDHESDLRSPLHSHPVTRERMLEVDEVASASRLENGIMEGLNVSLDAEDYIRQSGIFFSFYFQKIDFVSCVKFLSTCRPSRQAEPMILREKNVINSLMRWILSQMCPCSR